MDSLPCHWIMRDYSGDFRKCRQEPCLMTAWSLFEQSLAPPMPNHSIVSDSMPLRKPIVHVEGSEVPVLNPHIVPGAVLQLVAPCSSGKSWRLRQWLKMMQELYPKHRFLSIGVRITHCTDQHFEMQEKDGIRCELYTDLEYKDVRDMTNESLVVQLQSLLRF